MSKVLWIVLVASSIWVFVDATTHRKRGTPVVSPTRHLTIGSPIAWAAGCLLLWIVVFPLYLVGRGRADGATRAMNR